MTNKKPKVKPSINRNLMISASTYSQTRAKFKIIARRYQMIALLLYVIGVVVTLAVNSTLGLVFFLVGIWFSGNAHMYYWYDGKLLKAEIDEFTAQQTLHKILTSDDKN